MASQSNPTIVFNKEEGIISLVGKSVATDIEDFWIPFIEDVEDYLKDPRDITISFELEFFNTRSAKYILKLLKLLKNALSESERNLLVKWISDDEDIHEAGIDYSEILSFGTWKHIQKD